MKRIKILTAVAAMVCCTAATSQAALAIGAQNQAPTLFAFGASGTTMTMGFDNGAGLDGTLQSWAVAGGLGTLFFYQINNNGPGTTFIEHLTISGLDGLTVDAGYSTTSSGIIPSTVDRSADPGGSVVTWDFTGPVIGNGSSSRILVLDTSYTGPLGGVVFAGILDGSGATAQALAVPEPTTMIAGALLLLPFGASTLRFVRKSRTE